MRQLKLRTTLILTFSLLIISFQSCEKEEGENESKISSNGTSRSHRSGQDCMSCHKQGGSGEGWFLVAGTTYDIAKTNVYPNANVKLYTGVNGTGTLKYTIQGDALGNFYTTQNIDFGTGLYVSVQGTGAPKNMLTVVTNENCNSCHGTSTEKIWTN